MKILIGQFCQEGDSFSPKVSELVPAHCVYLTGQAIRDAYAGTRTQLGAFIELAEDAGADILYTQAVSFVSSGCVSKAAFDTVSSGIVDGIKSFKPDIIFLNLHGACLLEHSHDGDGTMLRLVRAAAGERCVICSPFDMHAYMTFDMVSSLNALAGYKTYPHIDQYECAMRAGRLALKKYRENIPVSIAMTRVPLIVAAERGQTDRAPIGPIVNYGKKLENEGKIYSFALSVVQPWMDIERVGCTATVCTATPEDAVKYSRELADMLWAIRGDSQVQPMRITQAIERARALRGGKPVLFVDSADSPGAGATGDSSYVVQALIEHGADLKSMHNVVDKRAAALAASLPEGADIECELGFTETPAFGRPMRFKGVVERHCPPQAVANGRAYDLGKRTVLRCGETRVMVMENAGCGHSPQLYASAGYDIADFDVVGVRSALQYRTDFEGAYSEDILVDSPGASSANIAAMPFCNTVWPTYPMNKDAEFTPVTMLSVR